MKLKNSDILELPDAPGFISKPPQYTASEMAALCEQMLPYWNAQRLLQPEQPLTGKPFSLTQESNNRDED
jgi:hypothetical protein